MLASDMAEARNKRIVIDDFDGQVIKQLVCYIQTASNDESLETFAQDLLLIADKYDVDGLKIFAQLQLQNGLSVDTVCGVLAAALIVPDAEELRDECCRFILKKSSSSQSAFKLAKAGWRYKSLSVDFLI